MAAFSCGRWGRSSQGRVAAQVPGNPQGSSGCGWTEGPEKPCPPEAIMGTRGNPAGWEARLGPEPPEQPETQPKRLVKAASLSSISCLSSPSQGVQGDGTVPTPGETGEH